MQVSRAAAPTSAMPIALSLVVGAGLAYTPAVAAATRVEPGTVGGRSLAGARQPNIHDQTHRGRDRLVQNSGPVLFLAVIAVFLVWTLSRGRRQQRDTQLTQSRVLPGAEVMMTAGVYGTVVEVGEDGTIQLETSPGTVSRW